MKQIQTTEDVYPAIDELIVNLRSANQKKLADILNHRIHKVAWTTQSELLGELQLILSKALKSDEENIPSALKEQIEKLLKFIG